MTDDFLDQAQADWRGHNADLSGLRLKLRRSRFLPHVMLWFELAGAAAAFLVGVWFAWTAYQTARPIFLLSAIVMLGSMPAFAFAGVMARQDALRWEDETPVSVLRLGLRRAEASLRALRVGWWHVGVLAAFLGVLWAAQLAGVFRELPFLMLYSAISAGFLAAYVAWLCWRRPRLLAEREACRRLLDDMDLD
jgi:hypothetical protein